MLGALKKMIPFILLFFYSFSFVFSSDYLSPEKFKEYYKHFSDGGEYKKLDEEKIKYQDDEFLNFISYDFHFNKKNYFSRKEQFIKGGNYPQWLYKGKSHFEKWDTLVLWKIYQMEDEDASLFFYHLQGDKGIKKWLKFIKKNKQKAGEEHFLQLDKNMKAYKRAGLKRNKFYVPRFIQRDLLIHPDLALFLEKKLPVLRLGTASIRGMYYLFGKMMQDSLRGKVNVKVEITKGSIENFSMGREGELDAYIAQYDSRRLFMQQNPEKKVFNAVLPIYEEYLHFLVPRSSSIKTFQDLRKIGSRFTLFIGEEGSGTSSTWSAIKLIVPEYGKVKTMNSGGVSVLQKLMQNENYALIFVGAPKSPFMNSIDNLGEDIRIAEVSDEDLLAARDESGRKIYDLKKISRGTYKKLQSGMFISHEIPTLAVGAFFFLSPEWIEQYGEEYIDLFQSSISEIRKKMEE